MGNTHSSPCNGQLLQGSPYVVAKETELASTDPILMHQFRIYCMQHGHFTRHHTAILNQVAALTGFSGGSFFGVQATDQVLPVELPTMPVPMQPLSDNMEVEDETIEIGRAHV